MSVGAKLENQTIKRYSWLLSLPPKVKKSTKNKMILNVTKLAVCNVCF